MTNRDTDAPRAKRSSSRAVGLRRVDSIATFAAWAALGVFVLVTIGSALFGQSSFIASDILTRYAPWMIHHPGPDLLENPYVGDTVDTVTPTSIMLSQAIDDGDPRFWNPYPAGGAAAGALPDYAMYSPLSLPWWVLDPEYATAGVKLLEIAVVALGCVLLARRFSLHPASGPVMALVFSASGFMVAWTNWPQTRVAAFLPLLLWCVDRVIERRKLVDAVPLALTLASMLLGGFPAVVVYGCYTIGAWALVRLIALRARALEWVKAIGFSIIGIVLGVALASFQIIPWIANAQSVINFESRDFSGGLQFTSLATMFAPDIFGLPSEPFHGGDHPVEGFTAVGSAALALIVVGAVMAWRSVPRALVGFALATVGVVATALFLHGPVLDALYTLPTMSTNFMGRTRVVLALMTTVLAGVGFSALMRSAAEADRAPRVMLVLRIAAVAAIAGVMVWSVVSAVLIVSPEWQFDARKSAAIAGVVLLVCAAIALIAFRAKIRWVTQVAGVMVIALVAVQAASTANPWWVKAETETFYPVTPTHEFLAEHLGSERYVGIGGAMLNGTASAYGLRAATGHVFHAATWREMLTTADPDAMKSPTFSTVAGIALTSPILDRLAVHYAVLFPNETLPGTIEDGATPDGSASLAADETITSTPVTGPSRGVVIPLTATDITPIVVTAISDSGEVLAQTISETPVVNGEAFVALDLDDIAEDQVLTLEFSASLPVEIATSNGEWSPSMLRPVDDGLQVVATGESTIVERLDALSRFRWSDEVVVESDTEARLDLLESGTLAASTAVVNESVGDLDEGSTADLTAVEDDEDRIELDVVATGTGLLTIADAMQLDGWSATIDGEAAPLVHVDHALVGVVVDEGAHTVVVEYTPPGLRLGVLISWIGIAAVALLLIVTVGAAFLRRRRLERSAHDAGHHDDSAPRSDTTSGVPR